MTRGPDIAYRTSGNPEGKPLLLLHGFLSCNAQWMANEAALGADHWLVMAELWGHGNSPAPEDVDQYAVAAYVAQFEAIREALGIERWQAIGQSYGAGLILGYACAHPERCTGVIVTNTRSALGTAIPRRSSEAGASKNPLADPNFELRKLPYHPIHARRFPEDIKAAMVASADAMDREAIRRGGRLGAGLSFRERLHEVPVPVLIANGVYEKSFQEDINFLRATYDGLNIVDLQGGHSVNIEDAEGFNAAAAAYLAAHAPGAPGHIRRR